MIQERVKKASIFSTKESFPFYIADKTKFKTCTNQNFTYPPFFNFDTLTEISLFTFVLYSLQVCNFSLSHSSTPIILLIFSLSHFSLFLFNMSLNISYFHILFLFQSKFHYFPLFIF